VRYVMTLKGALEATCEAARLLELGLTRREADIVQLVVGGLRNADIALLREGAAAPMMAIDTLIAHYRDLVQALRALPTSVTVLGLLPPEERTFPGSAAHFAAINSQLRALARDNGAEFLDWAAAFTQAGESRFYRDGFHPSSTGAERLANILHQRLRQLHVA
jgi:lysophospholipase L1-like esterase